MLDRQHHRYNRIGTDENIGFLLNFAPTKKPAFNFYFAPTVKPAFNFYFAPTEKPASNFYFAPTRIPVPIFSSNDVHFDSHNDVV